MHNTCHNQEQKLGQADFFYLYQKLKNPEQLPNNC